MGQSISMPLSCGGTRLQAAVEPTSADHVEDTAAQNESVWRLRTAERFATETLVQGPIRRDQKPSIAAVVVSEPGSDVLVQAHACMSKFGGKLSHPHPLATAQERQHAASLEDPPAFWDQQARSLGIKWDTPWDPARVLEVSAEFPSGRWFSGGKLNTCFNCIDLHVLQGRGDRTAIIHDSPVTDSVTRLTYAELLQQVAKLAGALARAGVGKGDRVLIYMPMIPEAAVAMLACARLGAVHTVVFGGFAASELATRIKDAEPIVILSASCGLEPSRIIPYKPLVDQAIAISPHKPSKVVVFQRPMLRSSLEPGRDVDWNDFVATAEPHGCVSVAATDPLYILYTSGTTGEPKGVQRDNGGHLVALKYSIQHVFGVTPNDVWWAASDVGWVVGHSYTVYAPLALGCTTVMYEGKPVGTPNAGAYFRVIQQHGVKAMFTAPTALRAIRRDDPEGLFMRKYGLGSGGYPGSTRLKTLFLAGERLDPETQRWASEHLQLPVIDHYWQTETGWPVLAVCTGFGDSALAIKRGSSGKPVPGFNVQCLISQQGEAESPHDTEGELVLKLPLPPGCLQTLYRNTARYVSSYLAKYPGNYDLGDSGYIDSDGYVFIMERTDDAINVAGHRLSTGAMEEVLLQHPSVVECAVVGMLDPDGIKGNVPVGFVVMKATASPDSTTQLRKELVQLVRDKIGAIACYKQTFVLRGLPKTRSGKLLRRTLRHIVNHHGPGALRGYRIPPTIEDVTILDHVDQMVHGHRYPPLPVGSAA